MKSNQIVLVVIATFLLVGIVVGSFLIGRLTAAEGDTLLPINRSVLETEIIATYQAGSAVSGECDPICQQETQIAPTTFAISTHISASETALSVEMTQTPGQ